MRQASGSPSGPPRQTWCQPGLPGTMRCTTSKVTRPRPATFVRRAHTGPVGGPEDRPPWRGNLYPTTAGAHAQAVRLARGRLRGAPSDLARDLRREYLPRKIRLVHWQTTSEAELDLYTRRLRDLGRWAWRCPWNPLASPVNATIPREQQPGSSVKKELFAPLGGIDGSCCRDQVESCAALLAVRVRGGQEVTSSRTLCSGSNARHRGV